MLESSPVSFSSFSEPASVECCVVAIVNNVTTGYMGAGHCPAVRQVVLAPMAVEVWVVLPDEYSLPHSPHKPVWLSVNHLDPV